MGISCSICQFDELTKICGYSAHVFTFQDGTAKYIFNFELDAFLNIDQAKITAEFDNYNKLVRLSNNIIGIETKKIQMHLLSGYIENINNNRSDNLIFTYDIQGAEVFVYVNYDIKSMTHNYLGINRTFDPESLCKCFTLLIYIADEYFEEFDKIQYYLVNKDVYMGCL